MGFKGKKIITLESRQLFKNDNSLKTKNVKVFSQRNLF